MELEMVHDSTEVTVVQTEDTQEQTEESADGQMILTEVDEKQAEDDKLSDPSPPRDEDEDDVPSDFFDDFSNQDFMAGLDVVDVWDDEYMEARLRNKIQDKERELESHNRCRDRLDDRFRQTRRSRSRDRACYRYQDRRYRKSRERSRNSMEKSRNSRDKSRNTREKSRNSRERNRRVRSRSRGRRSRERKKDEEIKVHKDKESKENKEGKENKESKENKKENSEIHSIRERRDPEKTKRDIQKDKDKCAKDKEAKIISEKLKVVETGLVPPGTEMDVDLTTLNAVLVQNPKEISKSVGNEPTHARQNSKSISPGFRPVPVRRHRRYSREGSFERKNYYRRLGRSPYKYKSRSPMHFKLSPERIIYKEGRHRYRDSSPVILKRSMDRSINYSPLSNISEREMWLRQRSETKFSPTREPSLGNRQSRDFLDELADKLNSEKKNKPSYKKMREKLNETSYHHLPAPHGASPHLGSVPQPVPMPGPSLPVPVPVPAPAYISSAQFFPPHAGAGPQYDQQFFIGDSFLNPNLFGPYDNNFAPGTMPSGSPYCAPPEYPNSTMTSHPNSNLNPSNYSGSNIEVPTSNTNPQKEKEAFAKLFEDNKISLSDFLSISAKHTDPTKPVNVQKKIKVISLCQDAIKSLDDDSKLTGRLFMRKLKKESDKTSEGKFSSPLRKIPVVRFAFTTLSKGNEEKSLLQTALDKLLASLGLFMAAPVKTPPPLVAPEPPSISVSIKLEPAYASPGVDSAIQAVRIEPNTGKKYLTKMCQTDPAKCNICEIRKARKYANHGVQCTSDVVDSGTQITDEDLSLLSSMVPLRSSLKNQSLAHLTPAQLLGRSGMGEMQKKDNFNIMDMSPEKWSNRPDFQNRFEPAQHNMNSMSPPKMPTRGNDNMARSNVFDSNIPNRPNYGMNDRPHGNQNFSPRMQQGFPNMPGNEEGPNNYNQRQFFHPQDNRGGHRNSFGARPFF